MLQQHPRSIGRIEIGLAGARSGTSGVGCHTTFVATSSGSMCLGPPLTTPSSARQFTETGDFLFFRARGRDRASDQPNR